jgi:hypothetical protein
MHIDSWLCSRDWASIRLEAITARVIDKYTSHLKKLADYVRDLSQG